MKFVKMHGCGNDFILVDGLEDRPHPSLQNQVPRLCDRHFGVGADGVLLFEPSSCADARMTTYNADGSEAEMCGNGVRCLGALLFDLGRADPPRATIETPGGVKTVTRLDQMDGRILYEVDMGQPVFLHADGDAAGTPPGPGKNQGSSLSVELNGKSITGVPVSMGNPHFVVFVRNLDDYPVHEQGAALERAEIFPEGTNVEFVERLDAHTLAQRTWERGVGETLACGTGACAAAATAMDGGETENPVTLRLKGGELRVAWQETGILLMSGEVSEVFCGIIHPDR